jgi:hypothetical protein
MITISKQPAFKSDKNRFEIWMVLRRDEDNGAIRLVRKIFQLVIFTGN